MRPERWKRILKILPFGVAAIALIGFVVMGLWNWLVPELFGWRTIGFWQAWGLLILGRILFGGFHHSGGRWRHRMMERYDRMTPEEREKFRQGLQARWGCTAQPPKS